MVPCTVRRRTLEEHTSYRTRAFNCKLHRRLCITINRQSVRRVEIAHDFCLCTFQEHLHQRVHINRIYRLKTRQFKRLLQIQVIDIKVVVLRLFRRLLLDLLFFNRFLRNLFHRLFNRLLNWLWLFDILFRLLFFSLGFRHRHRFRRIRLHFGSGFFRNLRSFRL